MPTPTLLLATLPALRTALRSIDVKHTLKTLSATVAAWLLLFAARYVRWWRATHDALCRSGFPVLRDTDPLGLLGFIWPALESLRGETFLDWRNGVFKRLGSSTVVMPGPFWMPTSLMTKDPALVKRMLQDKFNDYIKPEYLAEIAGDIIGEKGLGTVPHGPHCPDKGAYWYRARKLSFTLFTPANLGGFIRESTLASVRRYCDIVDDLVAKRENVPVLMLSRKFAMDVAGKVIFGTSLGGLDTSEYTARERAFDQSQMHIVFRSAAPKSRWFNWLAFPQERRHVRNVRLIASYINSVLDRRLADNDASKRDMLQTYINNGEPRNVLYDMVLSFMSASRDNISGTLTFALAWLAAYPRAQRKLRAELRASPIKRGADGTLEFHPGDRVPYLESVLTETLRLSPAVFVDGKQAAVDDVLPTGQRIPKGTMVFFDIYAMGRDEATFAPDPDEFRPERWDAIKHVDLAYELPIFQPGLRSCVGENLARLEARCALAALVDKYEWVLTPESAGWRGEYVIGSVLSPRNVSVLKAVPCE